MKLLNNNLQKLENKEGVILPQYDRASVVSGIMHMSIGGFHRSHQAVYVDDILSSGNNEWGICAVGLMPQDKENIEKLNAQDTLYTVLERNAESDTARVVGSIIEAIHAPSSPQSVLERLSDETIKILSLTITEKGYCYDSDNNLDQQNQLIGHDVQNLDAPKTALGYIVSGLKNRKDQNKKPFTVMSCDNLPGNGELTKKIVLQFAELVDAELSSWINDNVTFPNSMVDRITPVTTQDIIETIAGKFDIEDSWPVVCEDYIQWILEDNFCNGRPPFDSAGVQVVADVDPYEKMKVRLLNGSHSALSYLSYLMGYREVDTAMNDPLISKFVRAYMDNDITPTLPDVPGINLDEYKDTLIKRFANPAISDQVQRLAEDGSQKIPNAIIPCIEYQLKNDGSNKYIALALAGWIKYLSAIDEQGDKIEINDPLSDMLTAIAKSNLDNPKKFLEIEEIFSKEIANHDGFVQLLSDTMAFLNENGAKASLQSVLSESS